MDREQAGSPVVEVLEDEGIKRTHGRGQQCGDCRGAAGGGYKGDK